MDHDQIRWEMAAEIARLRVENEKLRAALARLDTVEDALEADPCWPGRLTASEVQALVRFHVEQTVDAKHHDHDDAQSVQS